MELDTALTVCVLDSGVCLYQYIGRFIFARMCVYAYGVVGMCVCEREKGLTKLMTHSSSRRPRRRPRVSAIGSTNSPLYMSVCVYTWATVPTVDGGVATEMKWWRSETTVFCIFLLFFLFLPIRRFSSSLKFHNGNFFSPPRTHTQNRHTRTRAHAHIMFPENLISENFELTRTKRTLHYII